jgi:cell division protein ZapA
VTETYASEMYAHVSIRILEKEYQVACPASERSDLLSAADLLNAKMREIRDSGKVVGLDRVAVMAALNLANELLKAQDQEEELQEIVGLGIRSMQERLDSALGAAKQLSL